MVERRYRRNTLTYLNEKTSTPLEGGGFIIGHGTSTPSASAIERGAPSDYISYKYAADHSNRADFNAISGGFLTW